MSSNSYDQGYWHYSSYNFPKNADPALGYTHIAFFVRWCAEKGFLCQPIQQWAGEKLEDLFQSKLTASVFFREVMDETFSAEQLTAEGREFADRYYEEQYLLDFTQIMKNVYLVPDTEENYQKIKNVIDSRFQNQNAILNIKKPKRFSFRRKKQQ